MTRQISNDGGKEGSNRYLLERGDTLDQHLQQVQHKMEAESIQYQKVGHRIGRTDQRVAAAADHLDQQVTREEQLFEEIKSNPIAQNVEQAMDGMSRKGQDYHQKIGEKSHYEKN